MAEGWAKSCNLSNTHAIFEDTRLVSLIQIIPYKIWLGGRSLDMGGIGGVATWADCQGKGYASILMHDSVTAMRKMLMPVSTLYPFSFRYYGKFGWEIAGHSIKYKEFQQHQITPFAEREMVIAGAETENITLLNDVYEKMAMRYNLCIKRNPKIWKKKLDDLEKSGDQCYVIRDGKTYIGWFFCRNIRHGYFFESLTNEFAFTNDTALKAMMGFMSSLPTNVKKITIVSPYNVDLWRYFKEPFIETELRTAMQFRVVDIQSAVKARGYRDECKGKLVVGISDAHGEWNNGAWTIEVEGGNASIKKGGTPDVEMDIQTFSRLFCGYSKAEQMLWQGRLCLNKDSAPTLLDSFFHDYPTLMIDWF